MGLSLNIFPVVGAPMGAPGAERFYCFERLNFQDDSEFFDQITRRYDCTRKPAVITRHPIPNGSKIVIYEEEGIVETCGDMYGDELTFVYAKELKALKVSDTTEWNRAVMAFVRALPDDTIIFLMWC